MGPLDNFLENLAREILNPLIFLMFAAAVIYFLWGVLEYIKNAQSDTGRATGAKHIMWSIVGMVIMMGVYSILQIVRATIF